MDFDEFCDVVLFGTESEVHQAITKNAELLKASDDYGFTALHILMTEQRSRIVALLIEAGADIHARNGDGNTALHIAQDPEVVEVLVAAGADLNARNEHGQTPLIVQSTEGLDTGALKVMERLLDLGADPALTDKDGNTALYWSERRQESEKVSLLKSALATR